MDGDTNLPPVMTAFHLLGSFFWLGGLLGLILQVTCAVHCVRHRKAYYWLAIIFFFSIPGALVYFFVEWYPMFRGPALGGFPHGQRLPSLREIRRLTEELRYSDTVARRIKLATAYRERGLYQEGLDVLKDSCAGPYKDDPTLLYPLAQLYYHTGDGVTALEKLNIIKATGYRDYLRERTLLEAKAHELLGNPARAAELYRSILHSYPGEEVRCRLALLLLQGGDKAAAAELFREIQFSVRHSTWAYRRRERAWIQLAKSRLKEL